MPSSAPTDPPSIGDRRAADIAHVLARAVREGDVNEKDALRIIRHELRRRNTNGALKVAVRSVEAQSVIDRYGAGSVPRNGSLDALHCDHVYPLTATILGDVRTPEAWIVVLARLRTVVCITARENYRLEKVERTITGPQKYGAAGVLFLTDHLPWSGPAQADNVRSVE